MERSETSKFNGWLGSKPTMLPCPSDGQIWKARVPAPHGYMVLPQAPRFETTHLGAPDLGPRANVATSLGAREPSLIALVTWTVRLAANRIRRGRCRLLVRGPWWSRGGWARHTYSPPASRWALVA